MKNPMPWHYPEHDLTLVHTDDLIQELGQRGLANAITVVRKDGSMKSSDCDLTLLVNGSAAHALWAANNLLEKAIIAAEDAGYSDDEIIGIMLQIDYRPELDMGRIDELPNDEIEPEGEQ